MSKEPNIEPENRTICPNTNAGHMWLWEEDNDDWCCDGCGVYHNQQED